jgi:hypothetical protein
MVPSGRSMLFGHEQVLTSAPILKVKNPELETELHKNASDIALGSVLQEKYDGEWHPVLF